MVIQKDFHWETQGEWLNRPDFRLTGGDLVLTTSPGTDYWQRTHYGFRNDNGHALVLTVPEDFSLTVKTNCAPKAQYDQCGLLVRADSDHWIKTSTEFETPGHSRLGSVVTNLGYSDWATQDLDGPVEEMWYRIRTKNRLKDYLIEHSWDGREWHQLRIAHLHGDFSTLKAGIYACSPLESSFTARFSHFQLQASDWT